MYMKPSEERTWGALSYVIPIGVHVILGFAGWIAALVLFLVFRQKSRFVARHAAQSFAVSVLTFLMGWLAIASAITIILIPIAVILGLLAAVFGIVLPIMGAVRASDGREYEVPVVGGPVRALLNP